VSMDYEIKFLGGTPFGTIHEAMTEAFADYLMDMSYMTKEVLWRRAMKNGVDFACSPGAFHDGRLVGLTLVGLGTWAGEPAAFDACTGIVKAHRGQGLAGRIFDAALPVLRGRGTTRFLLEVIQENEPAVKAYERTGFRITRPMVCYQRTDPRLPEASVPVEIRPVGLEALDALLPELDWQPSWENTFDAVRAVPDGIRLYGAFDGAACVGLVVYYPTLRWIMSLVVKRSHRGRGIGKSLLAHALRNVEPGGRSVRVNNVDASDLATVSVLQQCGFRELVSQYEMEFRLS